MSEIDYTFVIKVRADNPVHFPGSQEIADGIFDGLPKEWFTQDTEGDEYELVSMLSSATFHSEAATLLKQNTRLHAELDQEKRLTGHLEEQAENVRRSSDLIAQDRIIENLIEKNDNQAAIIEESRDLQDRYDDSLLDWKLVTTQRDDAVATVDRLHVDLSVCQASNRTHLGEQKVSEEMVEKIVDAMQGAGYDISGWGNDVELEELERRAEDIATTATVMRNASASLDASSTDLDAKLDNIRTERHG